MSEVSNVCKAVEGHCVQAIKIVHHHGNDRFNWLISEQQSVNTIQTGVFCYYIGWGHIVPSSVSPF